MENVGTYEVDVNKTMENEENTAMVMDDGGGAESAISNWLKDIKGIVEELIKLEYTKEVSEKTMVKHKEEVETLAMRLAEIQEEQAKLENQIKEHDEVYLNLKIKLRDLSDKID